MRFFNKTPVDIPIAVQHPEDVSDNGKKLEAGDVSVQHHHTDSDSETISSDAQNGVKAIEAATTVWSKSHLIAAYILMFMITFVDAMQQGTTGNLTPYITSSFQKHSLTAYTSIMSSIIGGVFKLPLAKILDIWGRPQGFALMVSFMILGLILMASCNDVQTYAAAQVFYWVGYNGTSYTLGVFIADTSHLKNRGFMFAYVSSPYIATVWITGPLAKAFLAGPGFRWAFGAFTLITLAVTTPLFLLFMWNYYKAKKAGVIVKRKSGRTVAQSLKYYAIEFDIVGVFLLAAGIALFLLPFSLYTYQTNGWRSPMIISMIVIGGLLIIAFALYEKFVAPKTFIPYELLTDRTVLGACILAAVLFVSFYIWDSFFLSFLQVVNGLSVTEASYVANIYSIGSCLFSLIVGVAIRWSGRFKWVALYFGVPITILGVGCMIAFRQPDVNVGYVIMCQIFIAFGGGACVITEQIAVMAATDHQHVAVVLALEGMFSSIGGAIGSTVASAIWAGVFPKKLVEYLPQESVGNATLIYASLVTQLSYPKGSETRIAIERAYGDAQRNMLIAATTVLVLGIGSVMMWRDIYIKDMKQVKGRVI
ncbi:major facilitator superfamily domain-containing protein [Clohesyomyces aquaticus]|uniref:Major facilitator superfamily domain-containing protein n=1 Tax=Clohesyomyces aquaticus TaxID=1231657 RepID=A0A1Y1YKZ6_9PLEO|nr:major facilitator superfamily domain-containing protein [Clohesyomyces aquaticus]